MPKKLDRCVRKVRRKISSGKIRKTYKCGKKRCVSNPYAICRRTHPSMDSPKYKWRHP